MRAKRSTKPPTPVSPKKRKVSRASKVKRAKAAVSRDILTDQFDKRVDYVHVRKAVKKAPILFKKKVLSALQTQLPVVTKLYTVAGAATAGTTVTEQVWQIFHLKPWDGQAAAPGAGSLYNEVAQNDLKDISEEVGAVELGGEGDSLSGNYWIKQARMEVFAENTSANDGVLEVYELDYVPRAGGPINQYASFNAVLTAALAGTTTLGTAYNLNTKGVSPFDIADLLRTFGVRVVKKMTIDLQGNGRFTYPVKDYRRHYVNATAAGKDLSSKYCVQNMTKSVLLVLKCLQNDGAVTLRASAEKHYRIQPVTQGQDYTVGGQN